MKYSRKRVLALTVFSVLVALLLSVAGVFLSIQPLPTNAAHLNAASEEFALEDLYEHIDFSTVDTGSVMFGKNTILTLTEEVYDTSLLTFLNSGTSVGGYPEFQKRHCEKVMPLFTESEMRKIVNGFGDSIEMPVVLLDNQSNKHIVLFELNNLVGAPQNFVIKYNGDDQFYSTASKRLVLKSNSTEPDDVYAGYETVIYDEVPNDSNPNNQGRTYYRVGAIAYNNNTLRGMFNQDGCYEISFQVTLETGAGTYLEQNVAFKFIIADRANYQNYPQFPAENQVLDTQIYNFTFGDEFPKVTYDSYYFDVTIQSPGYEMPDISQDHLVALDFQEIGTYTMISNLKYFNTYLQSIGYGNEGHVLLNRYRSYVSTLNILGYQAHYGGMHSDINGKVDITKALPFYEKNSVQGGSDITPWVQDNNYGIRNEVSDLQNLKVADTLDYAEKLVNRINNNNLTPVRTNFPPVKLFGNVKHATGKGGDGNNTILSTVSFCPATNAFGEWNEPRTLEVGEPYEEAGKYLIVVYFRVGEKVSNWKLCQQTFFFEITNSAKIKFEVVTENEYFESTTTNYYAGELTLNQKLQGKAATITYDGDHTLGKYEIKPEFALEYASLGSYSFQPIALNTNADGSFVFNLQVGTYRLSVTYGAHWKSKSVFDIIIDDTKATGLTIDTNAQKLSDSNPGIPENVAIVGPGDVVIKWDKKKSGIGFNCATLAFYEAVSEKKYDEMYDPNSDRNHEKFATSNLYAATAYSETTIENTDICKVIETKDGWQLDQVFTLPGMYLINVIDDIGNQTPFILIIDDSNPTFVQDNIRDEEEILNDANFDLTNVVDFDDDLGVKVGFGARKLLEIRDRTIFNNKNFTKQINGLVDAGIIVNDYRTVGLGGNRRALAIGIAKAEISVGGAAYQEVTAEEMQRGYVILYQENTYYFRVTDYLGNIGEYYIILTHDQCRGMIYAESSELEVMRGDYANRGLIDPKTKITANTSLVTATGGMTNRKYVTFAFQQKPADQSFNVGIITLNYYPFTYDTSSPNYPFAARPSNQIFNHQDRGSHQGSIYEFNVNYDKDNFVRIALYDVNQVTPEGMYIITRTYSFNDGSTADTDDRDYYFIVDRQSMLYYSTGYHPYKTEMTVSFANNPNSDAARIATAADIDASEDHILSSNRTAWLSGFDSKYSCYHKAQGINYTITNYNYIALNTNDIDITVLTRTYSFPSLIPRFSYINCHQTTILGEGSIYRAIGAVRTESTIYKLIIADNSRNISVAINNGSLSELKDGAETAPTSANYDYLTLNLDTGVGTRARIIQSMTTTETLTKTITNSSMEYVGANEGFVYVIDPTNLTQLDFQFDRPISFYANLNMDATTASWTANGFANEIALTLDETAATVYTYHVFEEFLRTAYITNGANVMVTIVSEDGEQTPYKIIFDTKSPNYNLDRICAQDNLIQRIGTAAIPGRYVYGLSNDFIFQYESDENRYLDTKEITYREVESGGEGSQSAVAFPLDAGVPFAELIGLRDNEMRYYYITETDYAGHVTSYVVQLKGDNYNNNIVFIGAVTDSSKDVQIGIEMRASSSSVHQFFVYNNSFRFESGDEYYMVLNSTASWYLDGVYGEAPKNESSLITVLNNWINTATEKGKKCVCTLYDRIGEKEEFEFYNLREDAAKLKLTCELQSGASGIIQLNTTNYDKLPLILKEENLSDKYTYRVKQKIDGQWEEDGIVYQFFLHGSIITNYNIERDLIITVTDPFGRESITEYHYQAAGNALNFMPYGNTVSRTDPETKNDIIYIGDERGVTFSYLRTIYAVTIYDAETNNIISNLQPFISNDVVTYTFKPQVNPYDVPKYRIVAVGRASGVVLYEETFAFDTRLPIITWKLSNDTIITDIENTTLVNAITMIVNPLEEMDFGVMVSFTRTFEGDSESITLQPGTERYTFEKVGKYTVTLRNVLWAKQIYNFEIAAVDEDLVVVTDEGSRLQASISDYIYQGKPITRYIFTMEINRDENQFYDLDKYAMHGLDVKAGRTNRVIAGFDGSNTYYDIDEGNNTIIWRLALPVNETEFTSPIYIATTGAPRNDLGLNDGIKTTLNIDNTSIVIPVNETYRFIRGSDFVGDTISVSLSYAANGLHDAKGAPCYAFIGNLILVDCYYNGTLIQTLYHGDSFQINYRNPGYYEFTVHDMIGNCLYFGSSSNRTTRFMLAVFTAPMVQINGQEPVTGMIYNDYVRFSLVDYGNEFLKNYLKTQYADEQDAASKYFRITEMEVICNEDKIAVDLNKNDQTFYWTQTGSYTVNLTYCIGNNVLSDNLKTVYFFQILPSHTLRTGFDMVVQPDMQILSIKRDYYVIHDYDDIIPGEKLSFNYRDHEGSYEITVQTYNDVIGYTTHVIRFNIGAKNNSANSYFMLLGASGSATTNKVKLYYMPLQLYNAQGNVTIYIYKDHQLVQDPIEVDSSQVLNGGTVELYEASGAGLYTVTVLDADQDVIYSDSWTINATQSTFGYIVLAIVAGAAGVGIILFLRMRRKMAVK